MNRVSGAEEARLTIEMIQEAFRKFHAFVAQFVGEKKASEFARQSYRLTARYFRNLESLQFSENDEISSAYQIPQDREILGFSLWMHNFISELKDFMMGVGDIELNIIVGSLNDPLEQAGFFDYFQQAEELKYSE